MAVDKDSAERHYAIDAHWRDLIIGWAAGRGLPVSSDTSSISLEGGPAAPVDALFTTSSRYLVAYLTNGRVLEPGELARAAAIANAWNIEQLVPMLSVWNVRGTRPHLAGVCNLPLASRLSRPEFDAVASLWIDRAEKMFARCHEVFGL
jgi:hypothetical protein